MPVKVNAVTSDVTVPSLDDGRLLTPKEVSEMVGLSISTLRDYRSARGQHYGPPFLKYGSRVFYRLSDVLSWIDARVTYHGGHYDG